MILALKLKMFLVLGLFLIRENLQFEIFLNAAFRYAAISGLFHTITYKSFAAQDVWISSFVADPLWGASIKLKPAAFRCAPISELFHTITYKFFAALDVWISSFVADPLRGCFKQIKASCFPLRSNQ